jgi:HrpA-like RNA helicase
VCFRLYAAAEFAKFDPFSAPEIHRVELTSVALQLLALNPDQDPCKFPFIEPPVEGGMQVGVLTIYNSMGIFSSGGA